jgi:hypothetical protein
MKDLKYADTVKAALLAYETLLGSADEDRIAPLLGYLSEDLADYASDLKYDQLPGLAKKMDSLAQVVKTTKAEVEAFLDRDASEEEDEDAEDAEDDGDDDDDDEEEVTDVGDILSNHDILKHLRQTAEHAHFVLTAKAAQDLLRQAQSGPDAKP